MFGEFGKSFVEAAGEGREEWAKANRMARSAQGLTEDAPMFDERAATYPTGVRAVELVQDTLNLPLSEQNKSNRAARKEIGLEAKKGLGARSGQMAGTLAADFTQDGLRSFYWLLNAPQAIVNVVTDKAIQLANNDLYAQDQLTTDSGEPLSMKKHKLEATKKGYLGEGGTPTKGVKVGSDGVLYKRRYGPGHKLGFLLPSRLAIDTALGLTNPFGGNEGYEAVVPSKEDPTKTDNVIAEMAMKYIVGRTGNLLPYDEFSKVRPDVSKEEYKKYQAFKYDKNADLNPFDDGQVTLPGGILKATTDGIHGAELQMFGRSMPLTTAGIPVLSAMAGTVAGVRNKKAPIRSGIIGGVIGNAAGQVVGHMIENERRRRNAAENELNKTQL